MNICSECSIAGLVWSLFKCAFDLRGTLETLNKCLGRWIKSFPKENTKLVLVGVAAILGQSGTVGMMLLF